MPAISHRTYLKAIGRKPVDPARLRTEKRAGDVEIVWCPRAREWIKFVHEGAMGQ